MHTMRHFQHFFTELKWRKHCRLWRFCFLRSEETPPGSIAADELDIEIEGASLDDNDFALDDNVF